MKWLNSYCSANKGGEFKRAKQIDDSILFCSFLRNTHAMYYIVFLKSIPLITANWLLSLCQEKLCMIKIIIRQTLLVAIFEWTFFLYPDASMPEAGGLEDAVSVPSMQECTSTSYTQNHRKSAKKRGEFTIVVHNRFLARALIYYPDPLLRPLIKMVNWLPWILFRLNYHYKSTYLDAK